jgi:hypothetical protein
MVFGGRRTVPNGPAKASCGFRLFQLNFRRMPGMGQSLQIVAQRKTLHVGCSAKAADGCQNVARCDGPKQSS